MKSPQQVSKAAIETIKRFEGYRPSAAQLPDGRWMIGYGHTQTARDGARVSEADAEALLFYDLISVAHAVNERVFTPLTQNQFDALCAFVFNVGVEAFSHSMVLRRLNEGRLIEAACAMEVWRRADFEGETIVVDALVRRRAFEKTLFLTPPGGWIAAPRGLLPPKLDVDAAHTQPSQPPLDLRPVQSGARIAVARADRAPSSPTPSAGEDENPIAAAAASVSARLQALVPDVPANPAPQAAPTSAPAPQSAPVPVKPAAPSAPEPGLVIESQTATLAMTTPATLASTQVFGVRDRSRRRKSKSMLVGLPSSRLAALALVGLACFAWALYWAFKGQPESAGGVSPLAVAWLVGVLGIGCFGVAAYLMLERLGGDEGPGDTWL